MVSRASASIVLPDMITQLLRRKDREEDITGSADMTSALVVALSAIPAGSNVNDATTSGVYHICRASTS